MEKDLDEIEFPVLFYVCVTPAFHMEKILGAGYSNLWFYFMGKSRFGKTYGWAGHRKNGSVFENLLGIFILVFVILFHSWLSRS